jgi:DNA-binding MarR family transcriptional regulator
MRDPDAEAEPGSRQAQTRSRRSLTTEGATAKHARFPELDGEAIPLGITLTRAAHAHGTISEQVIHRHHSRNWLVFRVLYVIWVFEPVSARDVVEAMQLSRQTVSNTLRALEADGLITRTRDEQDARLITIRLTADGRKSVEQSLEQQFQLDSRIFEVLSAEERLQLASLLARVRGQIMTLEQERFALGSDTDHHQE